MKTWPVLTLLMATPLAGGFLLSLAGRRRAWWHGWFGLAVMLLELIWVAVAWSGFSTGTVEMQWTERHAWISYLGIDYFLGIDGLGLLLVTLVAIVTPMALLASWKSPNADGLYIGLILLLQAGLQGTFTALNFFHWFIFWELSLVPAFFLIRLWGGAGCRGAATQFFIYTMVGSIAMLLGFLALYQATGSFDFLELSRLARGRGLFSELASKLHLTQDRAELVSWLVFAGIFLGFAVKVPLFPFHTWLPAAYGEAPTPVTLLLTGAMSKMGVYGFIRILLPLFANQIRIVLVPLLWLAVATILFSALAAFAQKDLKRMLAYSSMNHLGYCLLGIFAAAQFSGFGVDWQIEKPALLDGVVLQLFNHGITASALFCFLAFLERRSGGTLALQAFGGLRKSVPVLSALMGIALFASLGLPGLNGFVGEFLIFKGAFSLVTWAAVLSVFGLLASAIFLLTLLQRVFHGPLNPRWTTMPDLTWRERLTVIPATALMFWIGLFPQFFLSKISAAVLQLASWL